MWFDEQLLMIYTGLLCGYYLNCKFFTLRVTFIRADPPLRFELDAPMSNVTNTISACNVSQMGNLPIITILPRTHFEL